MTTYFISQATGSQAQYVIQDLLEAGHKVHALVRDPNKIPDLLKSPGVTVFKGESQNADDVFKAAQGCKGAWVNTFPIPGLESQMAQGIVDGCKRAGVETAVASTTNNTGNKDMWDNDVGDKSGLRAYYTSKAAVEDIVRAGGFKHYTILRPGFIHFDFGGQHGNYNFPRLTSHGVLDHAYDDGALMNYTDGYDIGKYAAAALIDSVKFSGEAIELVGESLTIQQAGAILSRVTGKKVEVRQRTPEEVEKARADGFFPQNFHLFASLVTFEDCVSAAKATEAKFGIPLHGLETALSRDKAYYVASLP
jgi:uncharacterized protein YbjT (DUF2867 family)